MSDCGEAGSGTVAKALSTDLVSMPESVRVWGDALLRAWKWLTQHSRGVLTRGVPRRLRVAETVSLGEKRFVSILQVDGEQFLVAGSPSNIVLLAKLETKAQSFEGGSFESVFSHVNRESQRDGRTSTGEAR